MTYEDYQQELVEAWLDDYYYELGLAQERAEQQDPPIDWGRLTQDEMIDNEEEYPREQ